jgi:hypothetical protein
VSLYTDAQSLLALLELTVTVDQPSVRWAQLGSPVVTCESMVVGIVTAREEPLFAGGGRDCQILEVIDVVAAIARDCAFGSDADGNTDPEKVAAISVAQDADVTALKAWVEALPRPADTLTNHTFSSEGGLAIVTTSTSVYVGWLGTGVTP